MLFNFPLKVITFLHDLLHLINSRQLLTPIHDASFQNKIYNMHLQNSSDDFSFHVGFNILLTFYGVFPFKTAIMAP